MNQYFFTFGSGQVPGINWYAIVHANTENEARAKMLARLGSNRWAFVYPSAEAAGVYRYNLKLWEEIF